MTFSTPQLATPGATVQSKCEELGDGFGSTTIASPIKSSQALHPVSAKTLKRKNARRFRIAIRKLFEHIRHYVPSITININMTFPEAGSKTVEPSHKELPHEEPPHEWPPKSLPATMRGIVDISKRDPCSNRELPERSGLIVDLCSNVNLVSLEVVKKIGIANEIEACEHTWIEGATQEMKTRIKGIVKIKFMFVEEAVGIFPGYQQHYWVECYVPEDIKCNFDISISPTTARDFQWHIPKHLGTGIRVKPPPSKPDGSQSQFDEYHKNKEDKANLSSNPSPNSSPSRPNGNPSSNNTTHSQ